MIKSIKKKASQRSNPLTLIFTNRVDIRNPFRLKQLLELEQSVNQKLLLKFTIVDTKNHKEALPMI
jgi:hypothetical protein